jgi:DNA-damage-inducible protein J
MGKTAIIHARTEQNIKNQAENILRALGLTTTEAINIFLHQIIINKGLPFEVKITNKETLEALQDSMENKNINTYDNFEDFMKKFE